MPLYNRCRIPSSPSYRSFLSKILFSSLPQDPIALPSFKAHHFCFSSSFFCDPPFFLFFFFAFFFCFFFFFFCLFFVLSLVFFFFFGCFFCFLWVFLWGWCCFFLFREGACLCLRPFGCVHGSHSSPSVPRTSPIAAKVFCMLFWISLRRFLQHNVGNLSFTSILSA